MIVSTHAQAPPELDSCDLARGVPDFEQVKAAVFGLDPSWPTARPQQLSSWRAAFRASLPEISRLEQARTSACGCPTSLLHACILGSRAVLFPFLCQVQSPKNFPAQPPRHPPQQGACMHMSVHAALSLVNLEDGRQCAVLQALSCKPA